MRAVQRAIVLIRTFEDIDEDGAVALLVGKPCAIP